MAVSTTPQTNPLGVDLVVDTDADNTGQANTTGSTGTLHVVDVDNTANGAASYVKFYDATSVTVGTTVPDLVLKVPASVRRQFVMPGGIAFATGFSHACVTAGGTAGTTSPGSAVVLRYLVA